MSLRTGEKGLLLRKKGGDLVRAVLRKKGWTHTQLGTAIGKQPIYVGRMLSGERVLTDEKRSALYEALDADASLSFLLEGLDKVGNSRYFAATKSLVEINASEELSVFHEIIDDAYFVALDQNRKREFVYDLAETVKNLYDRYIPGE